MDRQFFGPDEGIYPIRDDIAPGNPYSEFARMDPPTYTPAYRLATDIDTERMDDDGGPCTECNDLAGHATLRHIDPDHSRDLDSADDFGIQVDNGAILEVREVDDEATPLDPDISARSTFNQPPTGYLDRTHTDMTQPTNPDPHHGDHHAFRIIVDGKVRHTVPCGVCEGKHARVFTELSAKYGTTVHDDIREQVRAHLELAAKALYAGSAVTVR